MRSVDRVVLRDGRAVERVAHVDPTPLLLAVARKPSAWSRLARTRRRRLTGREWR
jgi:hypothetical protein